MEREVALTNWKTWCYQDVSSSNLMYGSGLVAKSCLTLVTSWTVAHQTPLSMGFLRQEYWSGLPFPSPGDLPDPGSKPTSPALVSVLLPYRQILYQQATTDFQFDVCIY